MKQKQVLVRTSRLAALDLKGVPPDIRRPTDRTHPWSRAPRRGQR